jgi:ring-1,2-phenylacetyl-CoA epoxidase subunit PaaD
MVKRLDDPAGIVTDVERHRVELAVWEALAAVQDPEIPPLAITQLGIVERVEVTGDGVRVDLLPTFAGCPALDVIREDAERAVRAVAADRAVTVRFVYSPAWTSDRITPDGREALRSHGLTPPGDGGPAAGGGRAFLPLAAVDRPDRTAVCPFCGSRDTDLESAFGPTLCRTTHFCRACRNPFEGFKAKTVT